MSQPVKIIPKIRLKNFDPDYHNGLEKEETRPKTIQLSQRIGELQELLYANSKHSVLLLFQGMDASGKDGAVKHVLEFINPAGVETSNFKVPSAEEKAHDFLWRIHKAVPRFGNIGVFNRSHYEAVLAERVMNITPKKIWEKRFEQINSFEKILTENGVVLLKFFLHISKKEQAERFQSRLDDPTKNWKFSMMDLETRKNWNDYQIAFEDVLNRCSTTYAPWHLVSADRKWYRDFVISNVVVGAMEKLKMTWPKPTEDLSKVKIV